MHNQKTKKLSKKRKKKKTYPMPSTECYYQADNPLTIYYKKYIEKDKD
jgi:hypothetical protein